MCAASPHNFQGLSPPPPESPWPVCQDAQAPQPRGNLPKASLSEPLPLALSAIGGLRTKDLSNCSVLKESHAQSSHCLSPACSVLPLISELAVNTLV